MKYPQRALPSTLKALSLAVATLLAHSHAVAAPTPEQLDSVKLYGDVTIAQDSVNNWGPWEQFEAPAAGPVALTLPKFNIDFFRTLPKVKEDGLNQELAGYGSFASMGSNQNVEGGDPEWHPLELTGTAFNLPALGSLSPEGLQLITTTPEGGSYLMPDSGKMIKLGESYTSVDAQGRINSLTLIAPESIDPAKIQASFYQRQVITDYTSDGDNSEVREGTFEVGVIGYKTSLSDMSSLRASGFQAYYAGQSLSATSGSNSMNMTVNFGNSTWRGNFEAGGGIAASGSVSGNSFNATSINAGESQAQGYIKGNFTGPMAAGLMGYLNVTANGTNTQAAFLAAQSTPPQQEAKATATK
jgi:hypothetical protein